MSPTPSTLRATYLGWQSWLVESERTAVLVDPLLHAEIGRGPSHARQRSIFHPPRRLRFELFPRIDAVLFSHEHEDHFDVGSLLALDPAIPIHLSALSSTAARSVLTDLERRWELWHPGTVTTLGDLEIQAFAPDHVASDMADEWDTLGYLIRQRHGAGSFFSNVDVAFTDTMHEALAAEREPPLVFDALSVLMWPGAPVAEPGEGAAPAIRADGVAACAHLAVAGSRLLPLPGQAFVLREGRLVDVEPRREFIDCPPRPEWPPRPSYWPAPGEAQPVLDAPLTPADERELETELDDLARFLYGGILFRRFYSLPCPLAFDREPALALVLRRADAAATTFVFRPATGRFEKVAMDEAAARGAFLAGIVCWASDLLAVFRSEMEPRAIAPGYTEWTDPVLGPLQLHVQVLAPYFHPLRRPDRCLSRYRRLVAEERAATPILVRARTESP